MDSIQDDFLNSVWVSVWDNVGHEVAACIQASVHDNVGLREGVRTSVFESVYGAHEARWLAFYRYLYEVTGLVDQTSKLSGLWELAHSAGWALPHENICWVSERHHILVRDQRGRLHCETGPACAYPDGFAIYAVYGVRVPQYVIEQPAEISVERIDAEPNAEIRRVMIERYHHGDEISGRAAFMRDAGGERLDHDERFGTLWRRNIPGDEPIVMVEMVNLTCERDGSFKRYLLRVPPNIQTAHEAVAWTFDVPAKDYAPQIES